MAQETALTKVEQNRADLVAATMRGPIKDVLALRDLYERAKEVAIVLAPALHVPALPAYTAIITTAVFIDPTLEERDDNRRVVRPGSGEVYQDRSFHGADEVSLTKAALGKIMAAAGITVHEPTIVETLHEYHWRARVVLRGRSVLTGLEQTHPGTQELDLRDGAPLAQKPEWKGRERTGKMVPLDASALSNARRHAVRKLETLVINAALRNFPGLGLQHKYPIAELRAKPFLVPCLIPSYDLNDPEQRRYAMGLASGAPRALYGAAPGDVPALPPPATITPEVEAPEYQPRTLHTPAPPAREPGQDDEAALDELDAPPAPRHVCRCACGHQVELEDRTAEATMRKLGIEVCAQCYPNKRFNEQAHEHLKSLNFPKQPDYNDLPTTVLFSKAARGAHA